MSTTNPMNAEDEVSAILNGIEGRSSRSRVLFFVFVALTCLSFFVVTAFSLRSVEGIRQEVVELNRPIEDLKTRINALQGDEKGSIAALERKILALQDEEGAIARLERTVGGLEEEIRGLVGDEETDGELDGVRDKVSNLASQVSTFSEKIDGLNKSMSILSESVGGVETQASGLEERLQDLQGLPSQIGQVGQALGQQEEESIAELLKNTEAKIVSLKEKVQQLQGEIDATGGKCRDDDENLHCLIEQANDQLRKLKSQLREQVKSGDNSKMD